MEWKDVIGYEGYYQVSNTGIVRSLARVVRAKNGLYKYRGRIMTQRLDTDGYSVVTLTRDSVFKVKTVHRLVGLAFVANPEGKPTVNHKDGNKQNNRVGNLEWATRAEQVLHGYKTGLFKTLLNDEQKVAIKDMYAQNGNYQACAIAFRISWHMAKYYIKRVGVEQVRNVKAHMANASVWEKV